ncbi:M48 family metalloprotease [Leptolyngbya sp. CCNP1308]|uniref:M48 family metalloprotease n=1 Tax=Leptolyngbya sp. CCNP1308 TaxID=3110255 RepID=UPI002B1F25CC|nr:M48 family metalloprotease [Leptolyngbya sp. CCNP1308]MEA5447787.1 M48 family metalloprotease [Leptolyngbya sp. CCNP1308]
MAAFKGQKYPQALDLFKRLEQLPPSSPYHLKALMGQVRVHQRLNQVDQARISCQALLKSTSPQAQEWAHQVLRQIPEVAEAKSSPTEAPTSALPGADLSGFMPLASTAQSSQPSGASAPNPAVSSSSTSFPTQREATRSSGETKKQAAAKEPEETYQSLFHFQQLNQQPGRGETDDDLTTATTVEPAPPDVSPRPAAAPSARLRPQVSLPQRPLGLWLGQGFTAIALLWLINWVIHFALRTGDSALRRIRWPVQLSLPGANQTYTPWVVGGLILLALASPWLMDFALARCYGQKPLSTRQLQEFSPGALRLLRQVCRQRGWQLPELRVIPDPVPLCFSYGWLARNSRIVVSQGSLDQHSDEVLTALYGHELARMVNGSGSVLSAVGLLLLLLHTGYHRLAQVGERLTQSLGRNSLGLLSSGLYGLFWLLRQSVLWLSRLCCSWGDRRAIALTQHPDHLAEGLLRFTEAIAADLQQRGTLHPLHTSLEVLMPVSGRQAITPGSLLTRASSNSPSPEEKSPQDSIADRATTVATLVAVDSLNPYRHWLRVSASHPSLGERLVELDRQASLRQQPTSVARSLESPPPSRLSPSLLLLQKGPLAGLLLGGGIAMGLWFVGGIVNRLGWQWLSWLYQDPSVLMGGLWLGLGLGLLLRINTLFPDLGSPTAIGPTSAAAPDTISDLLHHNSTLPVQGKPVTLQGRLSGRADLGNWGCQDLYLDDGSGLVKLTNPVPLGSLQGLFQPRHHPRHWIGQTATVTGWSRYGGGMLWVDIHQVQIDSRRSFPAYGPIWATLLSISISLVGIFTILRGG